jgi:hypothetical protein
MVDVGRKPMPRAMGDQARYRKVGACEQASILHDPGMPYWPHSVDESGPIRPE